MKNNKTKDWYKGPLSKARVAELRYKLALARGFITQLQTVLLGISLPETLELSTRDGDFKIDLKAIKQLLKETADL